MYVYMSVSMCADTVHTRACGYQKRASETRELELEADVSCLTWGLGVKLWSSGKVLSSLDF